MDLGKGGKALRGRKWIVRVRVPPSVSVFWNREFDRLYLVDMTSVSAILCLIIFIYSIFQKFESTVVSINQVSIAISYPTTFFF